MYTLDEQFLLPLDFTIYSLSLTGGRNTPTPLIYVLIFAPGASQDPHSETSVSARLPSIPKLGIAPSHFTIE